MSESSRNTFKIIKWVFVITVLILLVLFAVQNSDETSLSLVFVDVDISLSVLIIICFAFGLLVGLAISALQARSNRKRNKEQHAEIKRLEDKLIAAQQQIAKANNELNA
ncbi:MAG: LapA family protein [Bacteroidetes bacterium]|nr:LapA family protein [Bacteroidota bacterium]